MQTIYLYLGQSQHLDLYTSIHGISRRSGNLTAYSTYSTQYSYIHPYSFTFMNVYIVFCVYVNIKFGLTTATITVKVILMTRQHIKTPQGLFYTCRQYETTMPNHVCLFRYTKRKNKSFPSYQRTIRKKK